MTASIIPITALGQVNYLSDLSRHGFWADWNVAPRRNLCNAPGENDSKVTAIKAFLDGDDRILVCTHATLRFAVDRFGIKATATCWRVSATSS